MQLVKKISKKIGVSLEERFFIELAESILGCKLEQEVLKRLTIFVEELEKWNKIHNLTAAKDRSEILFKHIIDSLFFFRCLSDSGMSAKNKNILDIGSGAGFPGIIIAIFEPEAKVFLVESRKKKAAFLKFISAEISLENVFIIDERLESLTENRQKGSEKKFDIATSRASMQFEELLKKTEKILGAESMLLVWSSEKEAERKSHKAEKEQNWKCSIWSSKDFFKQVQRKELLKENELKLLHQVPETAIILCKKKNRGNSFDFINR